MGQKERRHSHLGAEADIYQLIYDLGIKIQDEEYIIHESYIMNPESNFWSDCKGAFPFLTGV